MHTYLSLISVILTNNIELSLWEGLRLPYIKIQMPTGILWHTSKSLFQIVPPETFLPAKAFLVLGNLNTLNEEVKYNLKRWTARGGLLSPLSKKRWHSVQLSWCHTNMEMVVGFEDLFPTFTVIVQATYTHLQLLMLLFFHKERSYSHIPLYSYIFIYCLVFYFWSFIVIEEREMADFDMHLRQCSKTFYEINVSNKAL